MRLRAFGPFIPTQATNRYFLPKAAGAPLIHFAEQVGMPECPPARNFVAILAVIGARECWCGRPLSCC